MSSLSPSEQSSGHEDIACLLETREQETSQMAHPTQESHVDCELSRSAMYGYPQLPRKKRRSAQDHDDLLLYLTSKETSVRMSRLVVNATRLVFSLVLLLNGYFNLILVLIVDVIITGSLVLRDFPETIDKSPHATVYISSVVIETLISLGVLIVISLELVTLINVDLLGVDMDPPLNPTQIGTLLMWFPVLFLSCVLVYYTVVEYLQTRHHVTQQPMIVYTETGDPVVVIPEPEPEPCRHSVSRLSVDSLEQPPAMRRQRKLWSFLKRGK
ncbi:hypothetical protein F5B19DRAFT_462052 [Rostrohypoxylon terebratum]|nr:hypothetical protein F5B19DRAFT_462052 [Rostrohypoxylon terebratum]